MVTDVILAPGRLTHGHGSGLGYVARILAHAVLRAAVWRAVWSLPALGVVALVLIAAAFLIGLRRTRR